LRAESTFPVVTRAQLGIVLLIGAVLLAGTCVLVFGPARGARNDIGQVRTDLTVSRRGIFSALADATVQQGLGIAKDSQHVAHLAADDTEAIRVQTEQALTTVRDVLAAVGPISELKGSLGTVVKQVEAGVSLARTALAVAQQTLATGQAALAVAVSTLDALHASLDVQRQLLDVARQTLEQAKEINRKIPGLPVFPSATGAP
jgi:hypothetical protein